MASTRIFDGVAGNRPSLNRFDLSYTNTTSMSIGYLYPLQCDEVYPGTVWKHKVFCHAEVMPLVAPLMSDLQIFAHTFFVPYRLLYGVDSNDGQPIWEKFITGGKDGDYDTALPSWHPSFTDTGYSSKKIWDYIGNPMSYDSSNGWTPLCPASDVLDVSIAPKRAYNFIVNSFYRDEDLQNERSLDEESLFNVSFRKDYFTSALEAQQRGTAPALPVDITGSASAVFSSMVGNTTNINASGAQNYIYLVPRSDSSSVLTISDTNVPSFDSPPSSGSALRSGVKASIDLSGVSTATFTPSDMRLAFAIQRMQELAMRSGYRYTEWLSANFNAHPTDARLDRPEYIGGCVIPISISPLMQTSATETGGETPQGNKSGVGSANAIQKIGNYRVLEHGLIMTCVSVRPKPIYQQGINRQWLRQTRFDYYNPALAFLSEQGIYNAEIFVDGVSPTDDGVSDEHVFDNEIFGYQAHWNEMRCKNNIVTGAVREQLEYYALARKFANRPHLNSDFIQIKDSDFNHVFAVQNEDEFVVSWSNLIDAYLPIPQMGVPGLVDHVYGGI